VTDATQVGEARRLAARICGDAGFDETLAGQVAIVATELATNMLRHAGGGEMLVRRMAEPADGLELIALDRGPGIPDVGRALKDGHSSRGSQGTGLGAVQRLSTRFELFTASGGTAVMARFEAAAAPPPAFEHGAVCIPFPGETECGDAWLLDPTGEGFRLLVVDGLGHGHQAHEAAGTICETVASHLPGPAAALEDAHLAARATRGAAAALAELAPGARTVRFAGVGNVTGALVASGASHSLVSINGTLGHGVVKPREFSYAAAPGALLIMASDGLATRWSLEAYPGLAARHPALVAAVLYRDFWRRRDDVSVVAVRLGGR